MSKEENLGIRVEDVEPQTLNGGERLVAPNKAVASILAAMTALALTACGDDDRGRERDDDGNNGPFNNGDENNGGVNNESLGMCITEPAQLEADFNEAIEVMADYNDFLDPETDSKIMGIRVINNPFPGTHYGPIYEVSDDSNSGRIFACVGNSSIITGRFNNRGSTKEVHTVYVAFTDANDPRGAGFGIDDPQARREVFGEFGGSFYYMSDEICGVPLGHQNSYVDKFNKQRNKVCP